MSKPIKISFRKILDRHHFFKQHPYYKGAWFESDFHQRLRLQVLSIPSHGIARALVYEVEGRTYYRLR